MLRRVALIVAASFVVMFSVGLTLLLWRTGFEFWQPIFQEHFAATIGLIAAASFLFGAVVFLRQTEGPIKFDILGMKLEGAAGQVVLWALGVIVLSLCARLLW